MIIRYTQGACAWIDMFEPSRDEVREVMEEFDIAPDLMQDLTSAVPRSSAVTSSDAVKVTLDFPVVKLAETERPQEVKFIITKKALITARYSDIAAIHQFAKEFEVLTTLHKTKKTLHGGDIFAALLNVLYGSLEQKLDYIEARQKDVEDEIFQGHEREMVVEISRISRRLITFRQALITHDEVLVQAAAHLEGLFTKTFAQSITNVTRTSYQSVMQHLNTLTHATRELRETNNSLITTKQNEIMKILTIMAFVTFPLSLFTSMFGMNTETLPLAGFPGDFWIIISIMVIATIGFFAFFKYKRWI